MRPTQNNNNRRSRGRNGGSNGGNGNGNGNNGGGNNNRRQSVPLRHQNFDSNGPDAARIRGTAFQVHEKYLTMARDAATAGDRVAAESLYQHAEHYYRIMTLITEAEQARNPNMPRYDETPSSANDEPYGDDEDDSFDESAEQPVAVQTTQPVNPLS